MLNFLDDRSAGIRPAADLSRVMSVVTRTCVWGNCDSQTRNYPLRRATKGLEGALDFREEDGCCHPGTLRRFRGIGSCGAAWR